MKIEIDEDDAEHNLTDEAEEVDAVDEADPAEALLEEKRRGALRVSVKNRV